MSRNENDEGLTPAEQADRRQKDIERERAYNARDIVKNHIKYLKNEDLISLVTGEIKRRLNKQV